MASISDGLIEAIMASATPSSMIKAAKAELHLHLEGWGDVAPLTEIAPSIAPAEAAAILRFVDFAGFIEAYKFVVLRMRTPEHYALAARRLLAYLEQHG